MGLEYTENRKDQKGLLAYGLYRRLLKITDALDFLAAREKPLTFRIVDFGCADDLTLSYILENYPERFEKGVGLDVFLHIPPPEVEDHRVRFERLDLFKNHPYPFADQSFNIAICSAFFKHCRDSETFLAEAWRMLENNGYLILLDPCAWVTNVGIRLGYFEKKYCPNTWSKKSLLVRNGGGTPESQFDLLHYEKYWIAPNQTIHQLGVENLIPRFIMNVVGLHQLAILRKREIN